MKRLSLAAAVLLVSSALLLAGCSKKNTAVAADPNGPITLTVWCWDPTFNVYAMNEAAKIYKASHPNVTVNVVETAWADLQQKLLTALSANQTSSLPDIVLMQDNAIQKNVTTYPKGFLPVNGKVDVSQFAQYKVDVATINGQSYGVPFDNGASGTFLRRDIVEQAGLQVSDFNDITWERFIELGKIVKQKTGVAMISAVGNENDIIALMMQSAGTWFFDAEGKVNIANNTVLKEAVKQYKAMVDAGIILLVTDWNAYIASLNNGSVASTINGCWIVGSISAEASQSGKWAVANTPKLNVPGGINYSSVGGSSWVVLANTKYPDVVMDLLNTTFAGSVPLYETILPSSGAISTWLPASKSATYGQPNAFFGGQKIYEDIVAYAGNVPQIKYGLFNYEARDAVSRALADIVGGTPVDTALATAQKNVEFLVAGQ
ncbi:ABC transporter substrate-binding protein [Treponema primitia]|uniref:ABC transporter substrate-binding protein n=1 Tax=Treponema primitia TaxID=88058 RepID=UPI0002555204|nr:extracellular solute-binding protein [Treponema primitia]